VEKNASKDQKLKKIAIVGPESTGKSSLAQSLAKHYKTEWVPEFARQYLDDIDRPYTKDDLGIIALGQIDLEKKKEKKARKLLICDTNLIVIKIWSEHSYGHCDEWIVDDINHRFYDLYLLTYIDIPWEDDPLREHPHMRQYFYDVYLSELKNRNFPFVEIKGKWQARVNSSISAIDSLL
jgi:NadR type nicotinamide-nucleotide adenylyltransferase